MLESIFSISSKRPSNMDKGSPLNDLIRAIPVNRIETVLFLWNNEAFASALRHVRGDDDINTSSECHGHSTLGRWAVIHPNHHHASSGGSGNGGNRRCLVKTLLGAGPYWLLVNMLYYASRTSPLDLFTEAAIGFPTTVCMVSCNTPNYILDQFRQYRGTLPPSVHWLSLSVKVPVMLLLLTNAEWWGKLLEITRIDSSVVPSDFDPDIDYLPRFHEAINDDDFI